MGRHRVQDLNPEWSISRTNLGRIKRYTLKTPTTGLRVSAAASAVATKAISPAQSRMEIDEGYDAMEEEEEHDKEIIPLEDSGQEKIKSMGQELPKWGEVQADEASDPVGTRGLSLLSLDGGGVRTISMLYILKIIFTRLNEKRIRRA
ncbi:MAG: hypothetical protein LQ352_003383 [Teloschistes flavicans]|nr:MAG: hypothetical protein LQ352_003383 [Teloschistes flavicans]